MSIHKQTFSYGNHTVTLETGRIARQATGAVLVNMDDTVVLVTVVGKKTAVEGQDFFPLTVNYQEKTYAAGKIPGGFFKREGRPSEAETLIARLIDRPIRPLFPEGFRNEVQVVATVMSLNPEVQPDIPAMLGASAALAVSGIPFQGPIAAARVGYINGEYCLNTPASVVPTSELDLVVAGTQDAVLMVESEAKGLTEEVMLGAVMFGHEQMQVAIDAIRALAADAGTVAWDWQPAPENTELRDAIDRLATEKLEAAFKITDKLARRDALAAVHEEVLSTLQAEMDPEAFSAGAVSAYFGKLEKHIMRSQVLRGDARVDGRDTRTVRPITIETGILPRVHGSALFTRGETQAIVAATLGTDKDAQLIDALEGERRDGFMLHYNFPPYCVGECGMVGSPKRREIGHGRLARRSIQAVLPEKDAFPYVMRVVSEITESNGSSSMASVCGTSLALMDAGVPVKDAVAGVAMGLIKESDQFVVLTDINGDEDHLGDMDFKVAGTATGVTALQMDIKINGITKAIMEQALAQAQVARLHILGLMREAISGHRTEISAYAPRIISIQIDPEKIRDVIGKGGATIRAITEETGTTIDISQDGVVSIAAIDLAQAEHAKEKIRLLTAVPEVGQEYEGPVVRILDFGAVVQILPNRDGLVHISQIVERRIPSVSDVLSEGQRVRVRITEVDNQGRIRLTMKGVEQPAA